MKYPAMLQDSLRAPAVAWNLVIIILFKQDVLTPTWQFINLIEAEEDSATRCGMIGSRTSCEQTRVVVEMQ